LKDGCSSVNGIDAAKGIAGINSCTKDVGDIGDWLGCVLKVGVDDSGITNWGDGSGGGDDNGNGGGGGYTMGCVGDSVDFDGDDAMGIIMGKDGNGGGDDNGNGGGDSISCIGEEVLESAPLSDTIDSDDNDVGINSVSE
jgi:hypothetical protein